MFNGTKFGRQSLVDSAFVLRILLEYYRTERIHRYKLLKELFSEAKSSPNNALNFTAFRSIIEKNFP